MLKVLDIPASFDTPEVLLDAQLGIFKIKGNSYPENPVDFYTPVHEWFTEYAKSPLPKTEFQIHFKYFSTSSTQIFFDIFRILEDIKRTGKEVSIKWFYDSENEEIKENGETYSTLFYVPFEMIAVEEEE
ncbi:MAG: DUF1987 domain-containing protein [Bacteroidales bacterium]|nr:DUF1987 domain-containing protein [Bacteroidales bacterium]